MASEIFLSEKNSLEKEKKEKKRETRGWVQDRKENVPEIYVLCNHWDIFFKWLLLIVLTK